MQILKDDNTLLTSKNPFANYITVLFFAVVLYVVSCAPGTLWQDSGMFQYRIWHNDIQGSLGLALSHPLYHIIGIAVKYIPIGEFGYRVNLISAIAAAIAVANLFLLLRLWLGRNLPAVIAAVTLALSWTTWRFASIAEVYTLHSALFLAELIMLFQYVKTKRTTFLYLLALFNGLAIANHMWASIAFACYAVFLITLLIKKQIGIKILGIAALLWILAAAPYEYLIIKNIIRTGDLTGTVSSAIFGNGWQSNELNASLSIKLIKENLIFLAYNYPTPNILFFFVGIVGLYKLTPARSFANILTALLILFFVFAFRYDVPDRHAFFMPFYCLVPILIALGFDVCTRNKNKRLIICLALIFTLLPIPTYILVPVLAQKMQLRMLTKRPIPYCNDYVWFLRPWKTGYKGPQHFADDVFAIAEPNAIVYADSTTVRPLLYNQQVKGRRGDVRIISGEMSSENAPVFNEYTIEKLLAESSVYVVSNIPPYCPEFVLDRYKLEPAGVIWKITGVVNN